VYIASRAVVAFVERLKRDPEFREWYFLDPEAALLSHHLAPKDLHDVARVLHDARLGGSRPVVREALRPLFDLLLRALDEPGERQALLARCEALLAVARERTQQFEAEERRNRPWWRFWRA
jgi:hypothetical protein